MRAGVQNRVSVCLSLSGENTDDGGVRVRVSVRARVDDKRVAHASRIRIGSTSPLLPLRGVGSQDLPVRTAGPD